MQRLYPFLITTCIALIFYAGTAAPSILTFFDDSLEFQLAVPSLGIVHPTGYPLYTLVGALWSRLLFPLGNWAWRMNMLSAITGALAVGLLFHFMLTLLALRHHGQLETVGRNIESKHSGLANDRNDFISAGATALTFALIPIWWEQATMAEVYTVHVLFMIAIFWTTISVRIRLYTDPSSSRLTDMGTSVADAQSNGILRVAVLIGFALTHHRMTLLLVPCVFLYLIWHVPAMLRPQRAWLKWLIGLLAPLVLYIYIPIRATTGVSDLHGSYQNSLIGFLEHVNASTYSLFLTWNDVALGTFVQQVSWPGILAGLWGGVSCIWLMTGLPARGARGASSTYEAAKSGTSDWLLVGGTFLISLSFGLFYNVDDVAVFLIPAILCWTMFIGVGIWSLIALSLVGFRIDAAQSRVGQPIWFFGIIAFFIATSPMLYNNAYKRLFLRHSEWQAHDQAVALAKVQFPPESYLVGLEGEATAIKYMQYAEGLAPHVTALWANLPHERLALVQHLLAQDNIVYLTREVVGLESLYSFSGEGPVVRIWPRGEVEVAPPQYAMDTSLMNGKLILDGTDIDILNEAGGSRLRIAYHWRPSEVLDRRLKLSLRLHANGNLLHDDLGQAIVADHFPLRQVTFSEYWLPNERIRDVHYLYWPAAAVDGTDPSVEKIELDTIIYDANTIEEIGRVTIPIRP